MNKTGKITLLFFIFFSLPLFLMAASPGPMKSVETKINEIIGVLKDPAYQKNDLETIEKQHAKLFEQASLIFDFKTISTLATGKNWRRFTDGEKEEFADLFAKLLANTYIDKLQDNFTDEKVIYDEEKLISKDRAEVSTRIVLESKKEVPTIYRMRNIQDKWFIYDVQIEGISMIQTYRNQFEDFLFKKSPAELISHMQEKNKELKDERIKRRREGKKAKDIDNDNMSIL